MRGGRSESDEVGLRPPLLLDMPLPLAAVGCPLLPAPWLPFEFVALWLPFLAALSLACEAVVLDPAGRTGRAAHTKCRPNGKE